VTPLEPRWVEDCQTAIMLLDEASNLPTPQLTDLTDAALRKVIEVRDAIIERLRRDPSNEEREHRRVALNQVNTAITELASVEYPGALDRSHLEVAQSVLRELIAASEPRTREEMTALKTTAGISGAIQGGVAEEEVHRIEATSDSLPDSQPLR
jgi:hypothetical protein